MKDFNKFYMEVEKVSADVSMLLNVLNLYYKIYLYCGNAGNYREFCDLLHIINQQSKEVNNEMQEILKKYM